ncbi:MAG: hypothetical protein C4526_05520 [Nitrospiraceae bacterium]|nr:MAG: hypothetical protein C4526_05520 [Nitrospiraceae bacterium]
MNSKQPTKKRILLIILTLIIGITFLISIEMLLPENIFVLVLVGGAILFSILEYFAFNRKKAKKIEEKRSKR